MEDALSRIAALAPTLKEAELRCLIELTRRADDDGHSRSSLRQIRAATRQAQHSLCDAIHSLIDRGLIIASDRGSTTRAATYRLAYLEVAVLVEPGAIGAPPKPEQRCLTDTTPGAFGTTPAVLSEHQGSAIGTPQGGAQGTPHPRARVETSESIELLDRLLKSSPKKFDDATRAKAKEWIYGYMRKFGRERDPHPPDDQIIAQFLSIAPWPELENLLMRLFRENCEAGKTYAWFVFVALQRLHGISGAQVRQRKAELQLVSKQPIQDFRAEIAALAAGKAFR